MRDTSLATEVRVGGYAKQGAFSMQASAKIFNLLFKQVYSKPMEAAFREPVSNAYDAHVQKGIEARPICLTRPKGANPFIAIRDYGASMDDEFVMANYTSAGFSTKDGDDQMVGSFGIGSKAPLAYNKSFTVTCFRDGMKRVYTCFFGGDGLPQIAAVTPVPSTEEDGTEVRFAVKSDDVEEFNNIINQVCFALPTPPLVDGEVYGKDSDGDPLSQIEFAAPGYTVYSDWPFYTGNIRVRMGWVSYPVSVDSLGAEFQGRDWRMVTSKRILIDVPIGACAISASREELNYTPETIETIAGQLKLVYDRLAQSIKDDFNRDLTPYARAELIRKYKGGTLSEMAATVYKALPRKLRGRFNPDGQIDNSRLASDFHIRKMPIFSWYENHHTKRG